MKLKSQTIEIFRYRKIEKFSFGSKLKEIRIKEGITAKRLAEELGVQPNQVFRYEHNEHGLSIQKLRKISVFLNIDVNELLGIENVDARKNPELGVVYDYEIRKYGIYWKCTNCGEVGVCYGKDHVDKFNNGILECECENCGKFYNRFWRHWH